MITLGFTCRCSEGSFYFCFGDANSTANVTEQVVGGFHQNIVFVQVSNLGLGKTDVSHVPGVVSNLFMFEYPEAV